MLVINSSIPSGASQIESAAGKGIYKFWVNANDGDGVTAKSEVTINVSNVDPSPTDTIASASVKDGQSSGAIIDMSNCV